MFVENEWVSEWVSKRAGDCMGEWIMWLHQYGWFCMFLYMISIRNRISSKLIENLRQWYTADIIMYQWLTNTESNFVAFSECVVTSTWMLSGNESELYYYTQYGYINWESRNEISFLITMSIFIAREPLSMYNKHIERRAASAVKHRWSSLHLYGKILVEISISHRCYNLSLLL